MAAQETLGEVCERLLDVFLLARLVGSLAGQIFGIKPVKAEPGLPSQFLV